MGNERERRAPTRCARCDRTGIRVAQLEDGKTYCAKCDAKIQIFGEKPLRVIGRREEDARRAIPGTPAAP